MITLALAILALIAANAAYEWWMIKREGSRVERRYHAAVRALRTRQAVIDDMARERDGAVGKLAKWADWWFTEKQSHESTKDVLRSAQAEALFYKTQADEAAKKLNDAEYELALLRRNSRLAAQLKKLKARKA